MSPGTSFQPVLHDPKTFTDPKAVQRIVLLSGKIYYDLAEERATRDLESRVALVRIEELAPFPFAALSKTLTSYANSNKHLEVLWVKEGQRNQGAWEHVQGRVEEVSNGLGVDGDIAYREEDAAPAMGIGKVYGVHQRVVVEGAFEVL